MGKFHFKIIHGKSPIFWGHNRFGWWFGMNILPSKFGLYLDYSYKEVNNANKMECAKG